MTPELAVLATPTSGMLPRKASADGGHASALATTGSTAAPAGFGSAAGCWDGPLLVAGARAGRLAGAAFFSGASAGTTTAGSVVADWASARCGGLMLETLSKTQNTILCIMSHPLTATAAD